MSKSSLERKGLVSLKIYCPPWGKRVHETEGRMWNKDHGGMLLTSLFSLAASATYIVQTHLNRNDTMPFISSLAIKKMPQRHCYRIFWWRQFTNWDQFLLSLLLKTACSRVIEQLVAIEVWGVSPPGGDSLMDESPSGKTMWLQNTECLFFFCCGFMCLLLLWV